MTRAPKIHRTHVTISQSRCRGDRQACTREDIGDLIPVTPTQIQDHLKATIYATQDCTPHDRRNTQSEEKTVPSTTKLTRSRPNNTDKYTNTGRTKVPIPYCSHHFNTGIRLQTRIGDRTAAANRQT
ncbi:Hypothetical predicted protein [Pelobates cultripes]|uniref:Uncharacterized protein n=1 Tax=Pelobates cultripes TaxID=61616 RepID=A0AAD1RQX2_PELCU|nr:Hypothetical predicted protein [Pelobates cultripes]